MLSGQEEIQPTCPNRGNKFGISDLAVHGPSIRDVLLGAFHHLLAHGRVSSRTSGGAVNVVSTYFQSVSAI